MSTITNIAVPTKEQLDATSQEILTQVEGKLGMVPNLYATIGYSSNALSSFLAFSGAAANGVFSNKEVEAIQLAVSQVNDCSYCKSAHTAMAKMNGFTDEEAAQLRTATIADERLNVLTNLAAEVAAKAGHAGADIKAKFFALGYDEKALIDFVSVVIAVTYTNYVHSLTEVAVDFPIVK